MQSPWTLGQVPPRGACHPGAPSAKAPVAAFASCPRPPTSCLHGRTKATLPNLPETMGLSHLRLTSKLLCSFPVESVSPAWVPCPWLLCSQDTSPSYLPAATVPFSPADWSDSGVDPGSDETDPHARAFRHRAGAHSGSTRRGPAVGPVPRACGVSSERWAPALRFSVGGGAATLGEARGGGGCRGSACQHPRLRWLPGCLCSSLGAQRKASLPPSAEGTQKGHQGRARGSFRGPGALALRGEGSGRGVETA